MEKLKIRGLKAYDFDKNPKKGMPYLKKRAKGFCEKVTELLISRKFFKPGTKLSTSSFPPFEGDFCKITALATAFTGLFSLLTTCFGGSFGISGLILGSLITLEG